MLHKSAVHSLREIFVKWSLELEIKPYTLNDFLITSLPLIVDNI